MDLSVFTDHGDTRIPVTHIEQALSHLKEEGHLDTTQYTYVLGSIRSLGQIRPDHTLTGNVIRKWLGELEEQTNDYGIDSTKVESHIAPELAKLFA